MSEPSEADLEPTLSQARHRVTNTFHLLSALARLRAQRGLDLTAFPALIWMSETIGLLGTLERHTRGAEIDMAAFLRDMLPSWQERDADGTIELCLEADAVRLSDAVASSVALIAYELTAEAMACHFPETRRGKITLSLTLPREGACRLCVTDNGVGRSAGPESFGLWLVRSLTAQLKGEFSVTGGDGANTASLVFEPRS